MGILYDLLGKKCSICKKNKGTIKVMGENPKDHKEVYICEKCYKKMTNDNGFNIKK